MIQHVSKVFFLTITACALMGAENTCQLPEGDATGQDEDSVTYPASGQNPAPGSTPIVDDVNAQVDEDQDIVVGGGSGGEIERDNNNERDEDEREVDAEDDYMQCIEQECRNLSDEEATQCRAKCAEQTEDVRDCPALCQSFAVDSYDECIERCEAELDDERTEDEREQDDRLDEGQSDNVISPGNGQNDEQIEAECEQVCSQQSEMPYDECMPMCIDRMS